MISGAVLFLRNGAIHPRSRGQSRASLTAKIDAIAARLEIHPRPAYNFFMIDPTNRPVSDWLTDLEISEAQAAAGQTVPIEPALQRLRDSIARLEAKAADRATREVVSRR